MLIEKSSNNTPSEGGNNLEKHIWRNEQIAYHDLGQDDEQSKYSQRYDGKENISQLEKKTEWGIWSLRIEDGMQLIK